MQPIIPRLNPAWQMIAPKIDPEYLFTVKNNLLIRNMLPTQINAGKIRKLH